MSSPQDTFLVLLKKHGYSRTTARMRVFEALLGQEPLRMHELVARTPDVDRASIYRAIDLFEQLHIVQRISTGWKYKIELSDIFAAHHHHLTCTECGTTTAINEEALEAFIVSLSDQYGFTPSAHQIEVQGICASCKATPTSKAAAHQ